MYFSPGVGLGFTYILFTVYFDHRGKPALYAVNILMGKYASDKISALKCVKGNIVRSNIVACWSCVETVFPQELKH